MSASQFPLNRAHVVSAAQPMLPVQNLRYVAQMLAMLEALLGAAENPCLPTATQHEMQHAARQHVTALAAYVQPWLDLAD